MRPTAQHMSPSDPVAEAEAALAAIRADYAAWIRGPFVDAVAGVIALRSLTALCPIQSDVEALTALPSNTNQERAS